jgi:hypothetical protein
LLTVPARGQAEDSTGIPEAESPLFSFAADMVTYIDNSEYFNRYREGYLHLGSWLSTRCVYRPVERLRFAVGLHLRKEYGDERFFSDARPLFRASYHRGDFTFAIGELASNTRHGLPDMFLARQWPLTHPVEEGMQFLFDGERVRQDFWAVYDSLNTPEHREHLMAGNVTLVRVGPVTLMALAYGDHYGGQAYAPAGDPVRDNLAGGLGVRFVHSREGVVHAVGAEQIGVASVVSDNREQEGYDHGSGSYTRAWVCIAGVETAVMVFKGRDFVAWKGNPLYRARDIYYYLQIRKRLDFGARAWLEFGGRFDFVDIPPADYFDRTENRLWAVIGGSLQRPLR